MIKTIQLILEAQKKKNILNLKVTKNNFKLLKLFKSLDLIYFFSFQKHFFNIFLKKDVIKTVTFFSKPGRKVYCSINNLKNLVGVNKIILLNTSQGLMVGEEALQNKQGGELICEIIF